MVLDETYPAQQGFVLLKDGVNSLTIEWCLSKFMVYREELREGILKEKYSEKLLMAADDVDDDDLIKETILYISEKGIPMDAVTAGKDKLERNQKSLY